MRAIEFDGENLLKILKSEVATVAEVETLATLFAHREYVFIAGYYDEHTPLQPWVIMPWFIFRNNFDYDVNKMQSDWDEIVRL